MRPSRTQRRRATNGQRGFLLVMVVVMLAVSTLMLAKIATTSMREASAAITLERSMRSRWAETSIRRYGLNHIEVALEQARTAGPVNDEGSASRPTLSHVASRDIMLAGSRWTIVVADESAKLNLRRLAVSVSSERLQEQSKALLPVAVRISGDALGLREERGRLEHWLATADGEYVTDPLVLAAASQQITLWGDGRLNVHACSDESLDVLWRLLFGRNAPKRVHEVRVLGRDSLNAVLTAGSLRETQVTTARKWMTDQSRVQSIWLINRSDDSIAPALFVRWGNDKNAEQRGYLY